MARYFFHICDGITLPDEIGSEQDSLACAKRQALRTIGAFFEAAEYDPSNESWRVEVSDAQGRHVFTVRPSFEDAQSVLDRPSTGEAVVEAASLSRLTSGSAEGVEHAR